jgi:hypothetical protein
MAKLDAQYQWMLIFKIGMAASKSYRLTALAFQEEREIFQEEPAPISDFSVSGILKNHAEELKAAWRCRNEKASVPLVVKRRLLNVK